MLIILFYYIKIPDMKKKTHPDYHKIKVEMTDGSHFETMSTTVVLYYGIVPDKIYQTVNTVDVS